MITQQEKDQLILALNTLIADYGKQYAVGLKYGKCINEKELFIASSIKKMVEYYYVVAEDVKEVYMFKGGTIIVDDGILPLTFTGTPEEVSWLLHTTSNPIDYNYISNDILYILIYDSQNIIITGDIEDGGCITCILDSQNCCTTEEMYKIYDKYICNSNCPTEIHIP